MGVSVDLLTNAQVVCCADNPARATTVALRDGRIAAVGGSELLHAFPDANVHDLQGRTLLPGINDSHAHLAAFGSMRPPLSLDLSYPNVVSIADIVAAVAAAVREPPADGWVRGFGWDLGYLAECKDGRRLPTRDDLDAVAAGVPVVLQDFSAHTIWVNSEALRRAGVTAASEAPAGGVIVRDQHGEPTGLLQEGAQALVHKLVPPLTTEAKRIALRTALELMHRSGITSVTDAALGPGGTGVMGGVCDTEVLEQLSGLVGTDAIRMRVNVLLLFSPLGSASLDDLEEGLATFEPPGGDERWFRIAGVKVFADGIPPNKTAWMHECYLGGGHGGLTVSGGDETEQLDHLQRMVALAHDAGHQVGVHVTGDRAIDAVVDAFVDAQRSNPRPDPRHYAIHADFVSDRAMAAVAAHGFGLNMQPAIKWTIADLMGELVGPDRAAYQWPMRSAIDAGIVVASSSDAPVTSPNWLQGVSAAVLRESKASGAVSGPEQRVSVEEALITYTRHGAWQDRAESWKGSIEPGKVADLCVVDARLLDDDPHTWVDAEASATVVGGEVVYGAL